MVSDWAESPPLNRRMPDGNPSASNGDRTARENGKADPRGPTAALTVTGRGPGWTVSSMTVMEASGVAGFPVSVPLTAGALAAVKVNRLTGILQSSRRSPPEPVADSEAHPALRRLRSVTVTPKVTEPDCPLVSAGPSGLACPDGEPEPVPGDAPGPVSAPGDVDTGGTRTNVTSGGSGSPHGMTGALGPLASPSPT